MKPQIVIRLAARAVAVRACRPVRRAARRRLASTRERRRSRPCPACRRSSIRPISTAKRRAAQLSAAARDALPRVYVPNVQSNDVYVIDPATLKVVDQFKVGINPQHVVPSWDLTTLWVANNAEGRTDGSLTPIDPTTGKPGKPIPVDDPYNMYFTPDGTSAIVVAEAYKRLDFRDPKTMALQSSLDVPECGGINHADFSIDGRYAIFTCEFAQGLAKIDFVARKVIGYLKLSQGGMPQDIRDQPGRQGVLRRRHDGRRRVRRRRRNVPGDRLHRRPARARTASTRAATARKLYVANRGSNRIHGPPHGKGSVSVIDFATRKVDATWPIPGGGSPDMGNVSADGKQLWLSGRYDNVVYVFDTTSGAVQQDPGRQGAARAHRVAAARPLFARAYGKHALARRARASAASAQ